MILSCSGQYQRRLRRFKSRPSSMWKRALPAVSRTAGARPTGMAISPKLMVPDHTRPPAIPLLLVAAGVPACRPSDRDARFVDAGRFACLVAGLILTTTPPVPAGG